LAVFEPKILVSMGVIKSFGTNIPEKPPWQLVRSGVKVLNPHIREQMRHLFRVENIDWCDSNWPLGTKMCNFYPKIWIFGAKVKFLYGDRNFCQQSISPVCPGLQLSHSGHPEKNVCFRAMGHFSGLTPVFGRFGLVSVHKLRD